MITTQYTVVTPYGTFLASWDEDENVPVSYSGSREAADYFKAFMELRMLSGRNGGLLRFDNLEPGDLYGYCQSEEFGVVVMPEGADMLALQDDEQGDLADGPLMLDAITYTDPARTELDALLAELPSCQGALRLQKAQRLVELIPQVVFDTLEDENTAINAAADILENLE
jgi:hypothetical protein